MAASDIHKHFKSLRVETGRRKGRRDPLATGFEDDSDETPTTATTTRNRSKPASAPVEKPVAPAKTSISSPFSAVDAIRDSDDDFLDAPRRTDRRPSPAPARLPQSRVTDGAGRRGSLDHGLRSAGLTGRGVQISKAPRSAVAQAAGALAYLDDSEDEDDPPPQQRPTRTDRYPSPAPRKPSDQIDPLQRSSTPTGYREPPKELGQAAQPSLHSVASPFAGTKYLQDSDSDSDHEEAVESRKNSAEAVVPLEAPAGSPTKPLLEVKRVDKPKGNGAGAGSGVSWRAFSAGRAEQRTSEIEALQASLRSRGKSISFGTHALTDDGNRVPVAKIRGRRRGRGKSPPRRAEDTGPAEDELADVGVYDPTQFKTNPFTVTKTSGTPIATPSEPSATQVDSLTSASTLASTDNGAPSPTSPTDTYGLENSIGSISSKVSPPQTIPEGRPVDHSMSPVASPTDITSPISRNSSTRSFRLSSSRPTKIPNSRRASRRANSGNYSVSPAHAFLSSWSRDGESNEPAPEPKPDDEGQAIGLSEEYIIGRLINQGGFGVVKEVHSFSDSGERVVRAVKIVRKLIPGKSESESEKAQQELEHEVSIWRHLKHRHILDLYAVYDTDFATFCIMDLNMGGTLFDIVRKARASAAENEGRKGLEPKFAKRYAYQLASALRYLHDDVRVCHRDVKLENCLIDMTIPNAETDGGNLRLCDFGLADFLHSDQSLEDAISAHSLGNYASITSSSSRTTTTSSIIGTLEYASPKGLSVDRKLFETAGDVWAFGVIVYALVTGELPFRHPMPSKTVESIMSADWDENALLQAAAGGSEVRELVQGCLERDIDVRLTISEALGSGWFGGWREEGDEEDGMSDAGVWS